MWIPVNLTPPQLSSPSLTPGASRPTTTGPDPSGRLPAWWSPPGRCGPGGRRLRAAVSDEASLLVWRQLRVDHGSEDRGPDGGAAVHPQVKGISGNCTQAGCKLLTTSTVCSYIQQSSPRHRHGDLRAPPPPPPPHQDQDGADGDASHFLLLCFGGASPIAHHQQRVRGGGAAPPQTPTAGASSRLWLHPPGQSLHSYKRRVHITHDIEHC